MMVTINVRLPDELTEQARSLGLLTDEKLAEMIRAEIWRKRQAAWTELKEMLEPVQMDFRAEFGTLDEDEAQAMIDQWIEEAGHESDDDTIAPGS